MKNLLSDINIGPLQGVGPLGTGISDANAATKFNDVISKIIGVMTVVAFIWFTFQVVMGAIRIVTSGGDKGALEGARKQITTGIIGLVVVVAAIFIVKLLGTLLGIPDILNPTTILNTK
ncbi:MAG TPA: hypothetical protein VF185_02095 [Patescibacteria group bacterium]